jgi:hypothetical protein
MIKIIIVIIGILKTSKNYGKPLKNIQIQKKIMKRQKKILRKKKN